MNSRLKCSAIILSLFLTACSGNEEVTDLQNYIAGLKKHVLPPSKNNLHFQTPVSFDALTVHSPFPQTSLANTLLLNKPPIERYPLDALHLLGIIHEGAKAYIVLEAPDKKTYTLGVGDLVGSQQAKITQISTYSVTLVEPGDATDPKAKTLQLSLKAS